ncbi:hypothetical protein [Niabella ginsengisoli]|uniref:Uncharacterized protein n=1 Tax=Niabella ginsengisoli TaxID=522298 RepID=A0ABS9SMB3_9BACT|nr:hypothetical protein [Niabella ginsengisoli]MCH5599495.1 hypothetical protein [Niabella ginsengisoli]
MKELSKMDNLDKGKLLVGLFPKELENLLQCIEKQCKYFLQQEQAFRKGWTQGGFFTADFWYMLVREADKSVSEFQSELNKRSNRFTDQFFDGYNALFTLYCFIEYADTPECNRLLRQAIQLFFGNEKFLSITAI